MKVKFKYKERIWFKRPLEIEIDENNSQIQETLNEGESMETAIINYIYANYSTQEIKDLDQNGLQGNIEIDIIN